MEWEEREESTGRHFLWWQEYWEGCVCVKQWRTADTNLFFPSTKRLALGGSDFVLGIASQSCKQSYTFEGL